MIKVREVGIAKEVMAGDVSPVAMFFSESLSKPLTKAWKNRQHFVRAIIMEKLSLNLNTSFTKKQLIQYDKSLLIG